MQGTVEVTDLFRGAFLLCVGGRLEKVRVRYTGRRIATFLITGNNLREMDDSYRTGLALVNPIQLREALNHLRDVMFDQLRKCDTPSSRQGRDEAGREGREKDDRKATDRGHQTRR